jgi:hypothetical protein
MLDHTCRWLRRRRSHISLDQEFEQEDIGDRSKTIIIKALRPPSEQ